MTTGYILIVAILILGGVIATVGDRIGTKVGKARLSLFNLRPKRTAVLVTILTGGLISASTLGILFAADKRLRQGVFQLEDIQKDLRQKREQLKTAETQKSQVESQLNQARKEQSQAQAELQKINQSLRDVNAKQRATQERLEQTQNRLGLVVTQYEKAIAQLQNVIQQRQELQAAIVQLRAERQRLYNEAKKAIDEAKIAIEKRDQELANRQAAIQERDTKITQLDKLIQNRNQQIAEREKIIAVRESRLKELEKQQGFLEQEVARLEKYYQSYQDLRLGKLALVKGQVLAAGIVRVDKAEAARQAIIQILQQANRNANIELSEPGTNPGNPQLLRITPERIEQLIEQIDDGREYVVRIFSAGNYVRGEKQIEFFADAARNQLVFFAGQVLASTTTDVKSMNAYEVRQRLDLLISASQFRARNAGIVESIQIDGTLLRFFNQLMQTNQPLEIKAVAANDTYTAGPLRVKLVAIINGQILFST